VSFFDLAFPSFDLKGLRIAKSLTGTVNVIM
jgi:hypothetical protein